MTDSTGFRRYEPVRVDVTPQYVERNTLSVAFRIILAIPHFILVGGPGFGVGFHLGAASGSDAAHSSRDAGGSNGVLGLVALCCAVLSWFAILFTGRHPRGLWNLARFYMRWRANAVAYAALLRDEYPPFGEGPYPVEFEVEYPGTRDRWSVLLRLVLVIPHAIVLFFLDVAWLFTTIAAWLAILFTGRFPVALYRFGVGMMRWTLRVESYVLLLRDEYPPFTLQP